MIVCDLCTRGILKRGDWGEPCPTCLGRGELTLERVSLLLDECPSTVIKLLKPRRRMRAKTAARILDKLLVLLARPAGLEPAITE